MIRLSQEWVLYLLIFGIFPFLLSVRSYVWGFGGYSFLNRVNIDVLKGISMTWIIFYSICNQLNAPTLITDLISKSGILGITLFLFVCGFFVGFLFFLVLWFLVVGLLWCWLFCLFSRPRMRNRLPPQPAEGVSGVRTCRANPR